MRKAITRILMADGERRSLAEIKVWDAFSSSNRSVAGYSRLMGTDQEGTLACLEAVMFCRRARPLMVFSFSI